LKRFNPESFRQIRSKKGDTLAEAGKRLGMRPQQVYVLERYPGKPTVRTLERYMEAYDVDVEVFFEEILN
jgi:transcriptional regulator with XRE-family HTH domain